jgi:hypothetical protein
MKRYYGCTFNCKKGIKQKEKLKAESEPNRDQWKEKDRRKKKEAKGKNKYKMERNLTSPVSRIHIKANLSGIYLYIIATPPNLFGVMTRNDIKKDESLLVLTSTYISDVEFLP